MVDAPFLEAQAANPFDPAPMLIWADRREEGGDIAGARALRGLAARGIPSLVALALAADVAAVAGMPDAREEPEYGSGTLDGFVREPDNDDLLSVLETEVAPGSGVGQGGMRWFDIRNGHGGWDEDACMVYLETKHLLRICDEHAYAHT